MRSCVKRTTPDGTKIADALASLKATCNAGAASTSVQNDPVCAAALADLQAKVTVAGNGLDTKQKAEQQAKAAGKKLFTSFSLVRVALTTYETAVNAVADGDAAIIHQAGCESRPEVPPASPPVTKVEKVTSSLGKNVKEAVLRWSQPPGAAMFEIEVNFDPQNPAAPWTSLGTTTRRSKLVTAPNAGGQFLARIYAKDTEGKAAPPSDAILATAR